MRITKITIDSFRGIRQLEIDLDETTVLIGENNSGKTSVLDALRLCLTALGPRRRVVFDAFDFHLQNEKAEPDSADPISIEIALSERTNGEWNTATVGRLNRQQMLQVDKEGLSHVRLSVTCAYDPVAREFSQDWHFLNLDGKPLTTVTERALTTLQDEIAFYYLTALRDAAHHFDPKGRFWRPFLKDSELSPDKRLEIERKLREINELVVDSHSSFDGAREQLNRVQDIVPLGSGDVVSIEAVPGRIFDMLAKAQVHLGTFTGAKVPIGRHGEGTQSLAVLMLFSAFLNASSRETPVVALEEPEAHLHPSAVRALWQLLGGVRGQKIISTHSGDLLSEVDIHDVRRLGKINGVIQSYRVPRSLLSDEDRRKFNYHVRRARGELLFARCWLLVEGESEGWVYPAAARALGMNLHREGVRVVEYSQSDVGLMAKVANSLGILWFCVMDNDTEGHKYESVIKNHLAGRSEKDCYVLPYADIEVHLLSNGYEQIYRRHMGEQSLNKLSTQPGDIGYWNDVASNFPKGKKTRAAADVAIEMEQRGSSGVSTEIREILETTVRLAKGSDS